MKDYENHFSIDFHQYYFLLLKNGLIYQKIATFDSIEHINNPYGGSGDFGYRNRSAPSHYPRW